MDDPDDGDSTFGNGDVIMKAGTSGTTPLYIAAQEGHDMVVRALIEAGADVGVAA